MRVIKAIFLMSSVVGSACDGGNGTQAAEVRVLQASYEFRGESYSSVAELRGALDAIPERAVSISTSTCADESRTADVVRLLRERQANVAFSTFEEVCQ
jgi:hypothetical protein